MRLQILFLFITLASLLSAEVIVEPVEYELDGTEMLGTVAYPEGLDEPLPAILIVHNWMGPSEYFDSMAARLATEGYVAFSADTYGVDLRPETTEEASQAAGKLRGGDRQLLRDRMNNALDILRAMPQVDPHRIVAIGFCYGGTSVLELARSGAELSGVVSFHGNLDSPRPAAKGDIRTRVLVLHGHDDPYVPKEQVDAFTAEMVASGADWQLVSFGNTVHSFSNPNANNPGQSDYNPQTARRAWEMAHDFFDEVFGED